MMSRRFITLILLAGAALQTLLPTWTAFAQLELPLLPGLLICIALHTDRARLLYAAVLAGLLHDALCPVRLGVSIPFFTGLALLVGWIRDEVFDQPLTYAVLGVLATTLETLYYALFFLLSESRPVPAGQVALRLAGGLFTGAAAVPLIAWAALKLHGLADGGKRRRFA